MYMIMLVLGKTHVVAANSFTNIEDICDPKLIADFAVPGLPAYSDGPECFWQVPSRVSHAEIN